MALKYQALNETVINKTTVIKGFNPKEAGTPSILRGFYTSDKTVYFGLSGIGGLSGYTNSSFGLTLQYGTSTTISTFAEFTKIFTDVDNNKIVGLRLNAFRFYPNAGAALSDYVGKEIKGTFIVLKINDAGQYTTSEYAVSYTIPSGSSPKGFLLSIPMVSDEGLLSLTFEPTE